MTAFVESCVGTVAGSAQAVERHDAGRPKARKLLRVLQAKKNILITTHEHPDPDALASSHALMELLSAKLPEAKISMAIKGQIAGGVNEAFTRLSNLKLTPWDEAGLANYDAIVLLDVQPNTAYCPLPITIPPTAVIDHHRSNHPRMRCAFCDIRPKVGATGSIIFSYFMELEIPIGREIGASLLFAIESDLAGSAGAPGELDNIALSSLTLVADTRKLYQMRYVDLPQTYYQAYYTGLKNAVHYDGAMVSYLEQIDSLEKPAIVADSLVRFEKVQWSLVYGLVNSEPPSMVLSLRTSNTQRSAADLMRRLMRKLGEGGGHQTKAGGVIMLTNGSATEVERIRKLIRRRYLRALNIAQARGQKLITA